MRADGTPSKWPQAGRPRKPRAAPKGARWEETRRKVIERDGGVCQICHHWIDGPPEIDHIVPVPRDHVERYYDLGNLRLAHGARSPCGVCGQRCNTAKAGKDRAVRRARTEAEALLASGRLCPGCHEFVERTGKRPSRCWDNNGCF